MFAVEHEHLVGDLDVPHAVVIDQNIDLANDLVGAPVTIAVGGFAHPRGALAGPERGLDTAETAMVGAAERGVERGIRLPTLAAQAMPVVRPVAAHRQQVPCWPRHGGVEIIDQRAVRIGPGRIAIAVPQARHLVESGRRRL